MGSANKFKRHSGRATERIKIAASSTETTFTAERNGFNITTKFATIECVTKIKIATMKHFFDILKDGITDNDIAIGNSIKMVVKNCCIMFI